MKGGAAWPDKYYAKVGSGAEREDKVVVDVLNDTEREQHDDRRISRRR